MAFIVKGFRTVRNNWKKTVFFTGLAVYGVKYGNDVYEDSLLRTSYCIEAQRYGNVPLKTGDRAQRVTVFLNPASKNGRGRKFYEKNVAPILNLAGFEVTVVKTEYEGQAKKYMDVLDKTDAIVVAGGDGTLQEVITGLLRRKDANSFANVPIGFVPLGYTNTISTSLFYQGKTEAEHQMEAAMAVVKGLRRPKDVIHIEGDGEKHVYFLNGLECGLLTEVKKRKVKNWYMGGLKHKWAYIRETLRSWPALVQGQLEYTAPCSGCSNCYVPPPEVPWRWWHLFLQPKRPPPTKDYSNVINEACGNITSQKLSCLQFNINASSNADEHFLSLQCGPDQMGKLEFIKMGWAMEKNQSNFTSQTIHASNITFVPENIPGKDGEYMIDSEGFESMPIKVSLLKDKLQMFCSQHNKPFINRETTKLTDFVDNIFQHNKLS